MIPAHKKRPWRIIRAGGRDFEVYEEYDESQRQMYPMYPDFMENPEYTDEGRPFKTAGQENCSHSKPGDCGDCGGCDWFLREAPFAIIGVCMCNALKRASCKRPKDKDSKEGLICEE